MVSSVSSREPLPVAIFQSSLGVHVPLWLGVSTATSCFSFSFKEGASLVPFGTTLVKGASIPWEESTPGGLRTGRT
jgi:hypothetical protein